MMYNYVVKNVARKHGMTATFMPKLFKDNASGMHVHQSIWKGKTNLFHGTQYAELSELRRFYRRIAQACLGALRALRSNHELYVRCPVTGRRSTSSIRSATAQPACPSEAAARDSLPGVASTAPRRDPKAPRSSFAP